MTEKELVEKLRKKYAANPPEGIPGIGTLPADSAQMPFRGPLDSLRGNMPMRYRKLTQPRQGP